MSYIGKSPQTGAYSMLDTLTASATASYSLTLDSVAFVPESANHLIVSLNGTIQKAGSSYNVSGSTLTFSSTLASSDVIDFVLALGNVLDIGTPSDATVTNAKTNFVSTSSAAGLQIKGDGTTDGTLQLNCSQNSHGVKIKSPAHSSSQSYTLTLPATAPSANKVLTTDGSGNLSFGSAGTHALIQSTNITSNVIEVDFDSTISDTYTNYMIVGRGIKKDSQNAIRFQYKNGSSAITATNYDFAYGVGMRTRSNTTWSNRDTGVQYIQLQENCGTQTASFTLYIDSTGRTGGAQYCPVFGTFTNWFDNSVGQIIMNVTGIYYGSTTIDGFKIFCQSGNFTGGRISLYGVSHA